MATFEKIATLLAEGLNIKASTITTESRIVEDLGADSLDTVEMLMALEEEFGITISEEDAVSVKTVQDILNLIND